MNNVNGVQATNTNFRLTTNVLEKVLEDFETENISTQEEINLPNLGFMPNDLPFMLAICICLQYAVLRNLSIDVIDVRLVVHMTQVVLLLTLHLFQADTLVTQSIRCMMLNSAHSLISNENDIEQTEQKFLGWELLSQSPSPTILQFLRSI